MSDRAAFLKAIESRPDDLSGYLAYADWLDETGEPDAAHAYRWMGRRGLRPHHRTHYYDRVYANDVVRKVPAKWSWAWYFAEMLDAAYWRTNRPASYAFLPRLVFLAGGRYKPHVLFPSMEKAVGHLRDCLVMLREAYRTTGEM